MRPSVRCLCTLFLLSVCCKPAVALKMDVKSIKQQRQARKDDVASMYVLKKNGDFLRVVKGHPCPITNKVDSFKVSQHKQDTAMAYFVREGKLFVLHNATPTGSCPKADKKVIMPGVKKYNVVSNTQTTVVNTALDKNGKFVAWGQKTAVFTTTMVKDYQLNQCYGSKGKKYNTYVAFLHLSSGHVLKLKGKGGSVVGDKQTKATFKSLKAFKEKNKICQ